MKANAKTDPNLNPNLNPNPNFNPSLKPNPGPVVTNEEIQHGFAGQSRPSSVSHRTGTEEVAGNKSWHEEELVLKTAWDELVWQAAWEELEE